MTDKAKSALSDTAEGTKTPLADDPAETPADMLSQVQKTDQLVNINGNTFDRDLLEAMRKNYAKTSRS